MKNRFKLIARFWVIFISLAFCPGGTAQEEETHGFLNLVNVVPGAAKCKIGLTGKDVVPGGLTSAEATGWFIVPTGSLPLSLEIEGYETGSGNIDIADMQSSVFVIFLEPNPRKDKDGKPMPPKIKAKRCDALPAQKGFYLKLMSLCPGENTFIIGPHQLNVKLFESAEVPRWAGGAFQILHDEKPIGVTHAELEKDPFYLFVGTDHAGKYCTTLVRAGIQKLPPWMKKNKTPKP